MIDLQKIPTVSGIYKFTNKIKNKVYIGQAINLRKRISEHLSNYKNDKNKNYFYKAIRFYKIENFEVEILQEGNFNEDELNEMEITFIRLFNSQNSFFGYNLTAGGRGSNGRKQSQETIQKRIKHYTGKTLSEEHKQKIKNGNLGKKVSEETKQKLSEINLGKKQSQETIEKMKNTKKLNPFKHSEESKQKMSKSQKGKKLSEETKEKIRQVNLDKKHSKETKEKMSKSAKGKPKSKEAIQKRIETIKQKGNSGKKHSLQHIEKVVKTQKLNKAQKQMRESCCYEEYFYNDFVYQS